MLNTDGSVDLYLTPDWKPVSSISAHKRTVNRIQVQTNKNKHNSKQTQTFQNKTTKRSGIQLILQNVLPLMRNDYQIVLQLDLKILCVS